jgi:hypothetical protein
VDAWMSSRLKSGIIQQGFEKAGGSHE